MQRALYDRVGISSKITIRLENLTEGCDYDLLVYDKDGNQIGIAQKNGDGSSEWTLPEWEHGRDYVIRVENRNGEAADTEGTYRIQITEERTQNRTQEQSGVLERTVREDKASGERLSKQELEYLKIYANLQDIEMSEAAGRLQNKLYPEIVDRLKQAGIEPEGKVWELEINAYGKVTIFGELTEEDKERAEKILEEVFADRLWDTYMQASDMDSEKYRQISAYREISRFLQKAPDGQ